MTAREWLNRARYADREIKSLENTIACERERITSITPKLGGNTTSGSKDPHKFDHYVELLDELEQKLNECYALKAETFAVIKRLRDPRYRSVLQAYYVRGCTWEQVAVELNYSFRQVVRLRKAAIKEVEQYIPSGAQDAT